LCKLVRQKRFYVDTAGGVESFTMVQQITTTR